jgi:hypothetical protein
MQSFAHHGFAVYPGRDSTPDPVFPLLRQRSIARYVPLAGAWPFEREFDPNEYAYDYDFDDQNDGFADAHGVPRHASARGTAVRILGLLALGATLFGCGVVLVDSRAIHEALSWATFGHADRVLGAQRAETQAGVR